MAGFSDSVENGSAQSNSVKLSRREAFGLGIAGLAGLGVSSVPGDRAPQKVKASGKRVSPRSVILLWLQGGPSQFETFYPKPLAPAAIRGPYGAIRTSADGILIGELMPRSASIMKHVTLLRTVSHGEGGHERASSLMLTGHMVSNSVFSPSLGSMVAAASMNSASIPPYVSLCGNAPRSRYLDAGALGAMLNPYEIVVDPNRVPLRFGDLRVPASVHSASCATTEISSDMGASALLASKSLASNRRDPQVVCSGRLIPQRHDERTNLIVPDTHEHFSKSRLDAMARSLWESGPMDLGLEAPQTRDAYGRSALGQRCLLAKRLVESGVKFVAITHHEWDMHSDLPRACIETVPPFDQAYAALIHDLYRCGLLDTTLVICMGEFGRSPEINSQGGRGHWPNAGCAALAGCGLPGGMSIGSTDASGQEPVEQTVSPKEIAALALRSLGIDWPSEVDETDDSRHSESLPNSRGAVQEFGRVYRSDNTNTMNRR